MKEFDYFDIFVVKKRKAKTRFSFFRFHSKLRDIHNSRNSDSDDLINIFSSYFSLKFNFKKEVKKKFVWMLLISCTCRHATNIRQLHFNCSGKEGSINRLHNVFGTSPEMLLCKWLRKEKHPSRDNSRIPLPLYNYSQSIFQ